MNKQLEHFQQKLYHYFLKVTSGQELDSDDLVQTVFLKALIYADRQKADSSFEAWLFTIARNAARDYFRMKNTQAYLEEQNFEPIFEDDTAYTDKQEQIDCLYAALSQLDQRDREILILSVFKKMSTKEIAGILGISESAVRTRVHRAKSKLKDKYFHLEKVTG